MRKLALVVGVLIVVAIGFLGYLGYFGGDVFVPVEAKGAGGKPERGLAAVVLSGDMGFNIGMGPQIAGRLADEGIPVIGVNSLTYFRRKRSPAEVAQLVEEASRKALALGKADRLLLIGQSFGADMLHVGLPRLPADLRQKLVMVAMVVPTDTVVFRASPDEWLSWNAPGVSAVETARKLDWVPVTCVRGAEETQSLCPLIDAPNVREVVLPGGHELHHDVDAVFATLKTDMQRANRQWIEKTAMSAAKEVPHV